MTIKNSIMPSQEPYFKEYVLVRLIGISVIIFSFFSFLILLFLEHSDDIYIAIAFFGMGFGLLVFFIYKASNHMQKELTIINKYLSNMNKIESIEYRAHFSTKEFETLKQNLIKVLRNVKKREDNKRRYNAKLKLKNRQQEDMISAIAHEFRNPIASIMGYSHTLMDDNNIEQDLQDKFLGKIYNNGEKIEGLLSRLLLWNKFERGEANLHKSEFDIYKLLAEVKISLEEKFQGRKIELTGEKHFVTADRTLIEIVLKNLIENALKYSSHKVIVSIKESEIMIEDKGIGITEKNLDKVTKKFYRSGTQSWDNSMGLGLAIVKTILKMHDSELKISSIPNEGSHFSFTI